MITSLLFMITGSSKPEVVLSKLAIFVERYWTIGILILGVYIYTRPQNNKTRNK